MDILTLDLPGIPKLRSGKVREVFDLGDSLLLVATDRISAFDCVLPNAIPRKGEVLTRLSRFWFHKLDFVPNHLVETQENALPEKLKPYAEQLEGRSMIVKKAIPLPIECVVRGYLVGSGWKDYEATGGICGQMLPAGLRQAEKLPEPIFTPSTKAASGHDENISWNECRRILGDDVAMRLREWSIELYEHGRDYAAQRGIIIADTKFEFGMVGDEIVLIDECLTPDSSRFWPAVDYAVGSNPPSFDKQYVRDYLESLIWDKTPPAPELPPDVVTRTSEKYIEAYTRLTGLRF
jgi:phosphoribosylaminoimidazole-succinocarboxamide synthase